MDFSRGCTGMKQAARQELYREALPAPKLKRPYMASWALRRLTLALGKSRSHNMDSNMVSHCRCNVLCIARTP